MAVSRYDTPATQSILDTYVEPPFKEMQAALNEKQLEYDAEEDKLAKLPSYLKANIKPTYSDTQGVSHKNANYDKYINEATQFNDEINKTAQTLHTTSDPSEVRKLTSSLSNKIANWRNTNIAPAEAESANYEANWKKLQEDKNRGKEPYRAYQHDLAVRSQSNRDLSKGYIPVNFTDQLDYSDINKNIAEAAKGVPLNETSRKSFKEHTTKNGAMGFLEWEKSNGNNAEAIKSVIQPIIQEHIPHIKAELVHSLANSKYHYNDMINKGYDPNDENSILEYAKDSQTTHTYKTKEGEKKIKSNLLEDFFNNKKLEYTSAALGFTKASDKYGEKFDMSEYLTKDNKEKQDTPLEYSYSNTTPINSSGENIIKDPTQMSFHDFMLAKGATPTSKGYAFGHEDKGFLGLSSTAKSYARDTKPEGSTIDEWIDKINNFSGGASTINESNKKAGNLYQKYQREYELLSRIDGGNDKEWIKEYISLNKPAENFYKAYEEKRKEDPSLPTLKSRDVYNFINNNVYNRSTTNYTPILSEKQVEQKGFQLFGDENSPEVRTANKTKWFDKETGKELDFDNIPVEGTTMKKWLDKSSGDSKELSEKKKLLKSSTSFELSYSGLGGESLTVNGKTYVNGGSSVKERAALLPMSHYNTINTNPEKIYNNDGLGDKYNLYGSSGEVKDRVYEDKLAPIMDKDKKAVSSHTETDLITGETYIYYTDKNNEKVFKVKLDYYNQDAKDIIGIGTVKKEKENYDKP